MNITAVILCSGLSRRMGENKLLLPLRGKRLFEYTVDTVEKAGFKKTVAVTSYRDIAYYCKNITVVLNPGNIEGISSSIRLGVQNCGNCDGIMFFTADQPFLDIDTIRILVDAFERENKIIVPRCCGKPANPVIFPIRYRDSLLSLKGDEGGKKIYRSVPKDVSFVDFENEILFSDIDTREDMKKLM